MRRLWYRKVCAGSFSVSRIAKAHPVSRSDSDPLPQVGIGPAERFAAVVQTVSAGKPPSAGAGPDRSRPLWGGTRFRELCRAGVFARRLGFAARQGPGTMPVSSPTDAGHSPAGVCRIPVGQGGNAPLRLRLAAHPPPLPGKALEKPPPGRLPCKGSCRRQPTEGCGALPRQYPSGLAQGPPGGRERPPYNAK